jgi:hypothetical protein
MTSGFLSPLKSATPQKPSPTVTVHRVEPTRVLLATLPVKV